MKLPRDLSGEQLCKLLEILGYHVTRQTGSHLRLTSSENGEHHLTILAHGPLKIGTLAAILADLAAHHQMSRDELLKQLFSGMR